MDARRAPCLPGHVVGDATLPEGRGPGPDSCPGGTPGARLGSTGKRQGNRLAHRPAGWAHPRRNWMKELATLGGGCFWCLEAALRQLAGVEAVVSGYCGGDRG